MFEVEYVTNGASYNLYGATMTIKGSLHGTSPIVKRFSAENSLSPVKTWPQNGGFWGISRDVNKAGSFKTKAKARSLKAKAKARDQG